MRHIYTSHLTYLTSHNSCNLKMNWHTGIVPLQTHDKKRVRNPFAYERTIMTIFKKVKKDHLHLHYMKLVTIRVLENSISNCSESKVMSEKVWLYL